MSSFVSNPFNFRLRALAWSVASFAAVAGAHAQVFSENFESGTLDKTIWETRTKGTAEVKVQQAQVAHGKSALQIHYPKERGSYAFIVATKLPESVRKHFFGRASVYIAPNAPAGHDVLLNAGTPGYPDSNFLELGASGGKNVMASYQQNALNVPRGETIARGAAYPVGRWFLLEWECTDEPDNLKVWIDGEPAGELKDFTFKPRAPGGGNRGGGAAKADAPKTAEAPKAPAAEIAAVPGTGLVKGFSDFAFGFRAWGNGGAEDFDIYYDDIAIDTKRIGPVK